LQRWPRARLDCLVCADVTDRTVAPPARGLGARPKVFSRSNYIDTTIDDNSVDRPVARLDCLVCADVTDTTVAPPARGLDARPKVFNRISTDSGDNDSVDRPVARPTGSRHPMRIYSDDEEEKENVPPQQLKGSVRAQSLSYCFVN